MTYAPGHTSGQLPASFFDRGPDDVAPELLGCVIETRVEGALCAVRIVETEAYFGISDPGSHAATRTVTPRNAVMYGPPGSVFVYFTYGNHFMLNFVCESEGTAAAVLVRAAEPVLGEDTMVARRGGRTRLELTNGPGKVAQALGVDFSDNGVMLGTGRVAVYADLRPPPEMIARSGRIGLSKGFEPELRYYLLGNPYVSPGRPGPLKRSRRRTVDQKERS